MIKEKRIGNITDILLATVVTEIPAFFEEKAIMKNIMMNRIPMITLMGSQSQDGCNHIVDNNNGEGGDADPV